MSQKTTGPNLSSEPSAAGSEPLRQLTREPERGPPFGPCAKCKAVEDVALLCGPCADRFADHLMADPAFAATMAAWEAINLPGEASDGR